MELLLLLFTLALQSGLSETAEIPTQPLNLDKFKKVRLNERNYEKVHNLHTNWYAASIKALLAQLGRELYEKISLKEQTILARCLDDIDDKRDLVLSARCFVNARLRFLRSSAHNGIPTKGILVDSAKISGSQTDTSTSESNGRWLGSFRTEKDVNPMSTPLHLARNGVKLKETKKKFASLRRSLRFQKYSYQRLWTSTGTVSLAGHNLPPDKKSTGLDNFKVKRSKRAAANGWNNYGIKEHWKVSNLITQFALPHSDESSRVKWHRLYKTLAQLKEQNELRRSSPGAKVYTRRMYDLVLGNERPTMSAKQQQSPQGLMEMALDILDGLTHRGNQTERRESSRKWLSPRLAPVMPDKIDADDSHLSPTVLALYDYEGDDETNSTRGSGTTGTQRGNSVAPVPMMLKASGMSKQDREKVIELLMDVSGAANHVDDAVGLLKNLDFFGIDSEIFASHDRLTKTYERLRSSLSGHQSASLERRGFAFLQQDQIERLINEQHAHLPAKTFGFDAYAKLDDEDAREEALWLRIECIAENIPDEHCALHDEDENHSNGSDVNYRRWRRRRHRMRRDLSIPSVLLPVVLKPYMFSPVFGLSVLGPTVLSPSIFSPLILNPAVLSPYVLSPGIPMPFILSPYVLSPYVLSPLVMAPFILTPYVLSPNVINPYLLSPLILSPLVLCPDVLSPMALGGSVLSPTVASPAVLTETYLMASVLSPTFLSK